MDQSLVDSVRSASKRAQMVDLEALIRFIFPTELQHAMSTGRLLAFGFYGPLDADAKLRSGHKGSHVVGRWELDTMCRQFEREDILQVYMPNGKSSSSLSAEESEQLLAQADSRLKMAKGKAMMRQVTEEEVRSLFDDLERPENGLLMFHEMQERIVEFRKESIQRNKVIFPDLISHSIGKKKSGERRRPQVVLTKKTSRRVSEDVAPAVMFEANQGFNPMELATQTNRLLATRAYQICEIEQGNSPSLTSNVRLVRESCTNSMRPENAQHPKVWDSYCAKRGTHMGGFVKSTKSSTTVKRSTTIA